jgi:hypothetical protein
LTRVTEAKQPGLSGAGEPATSQADAVPKPAESARRVELAELAELAELHGSPESAESRQPAVVASHEVLFAPPAEIRCDACNRLIESEGADGDGFSPAGEGVYLWARGDEVRFERAPLCGRCASAIGMTALARWEIEEEEG